MPRLIWWEWEPGLGSGPIKRPVRGWARLEAWNQPIHRIRGRIEKIFGTWKRCYGLRRMRWRGLAKAGVQIRLTAIAYNMKRSLNIIAMAG
ncbi:transposase [Devosia sp.]|uniref:transposase n=1 Tax=Devosia sp. TaxID=1871048 RepID=UPI002AFE3385|nr:transposase [Devosia sp.]